MLTGEPVDVTETMYRYTTDVIASCAFGLTGNSLNDPQAEFSIFFRKVAEFSVRKRLAALTAFCAPTLKSLLKLKFVDDDTTNYLRRTVWSTVEYRWDSLYIAVILIPGQTFVQTKLKVFFSRTNSTLCLIKYFKYYVKIDEIY
jgi:hypothetical protein